MPVNKDIRALIFDVFGTTVDWRSTVTYALHAAATAALNAPTSSISSKVRSKASSMDESAWGRFTQEWRSAYYKYTRTTAADPSAKTKTVDELHFEALTELLSVWQIEGLWDPEQVKTINLIWHKLNPWPDTVAGLEALNRNYVTCTLSNGNLSLLQDLVAYGKLPFTHVVSTELFGTFKPNPKTYLGVAEKLGVQPSQCCMVAAHLFDLKAARGCGFSTAYVERLLEEEMDADFIESARREGFVDVWIAEGNYGFLTLAEMLADS